MPALTLDERCMNLAMKIDKVKQIINNIGVNNDTISKINKIIDEYTT
ncbi:hypothetical protein [Piscirickettsia salmonis]|nr:hypothetical protein A0O36_00770 [Piscirickettsiaceae bacterium NZ-RLO1]